MTESKPTPTAESRRHASDEWLAKWPNHCPSCLGAGATYWEEHHDPGYPGEPMQEPCHCLDAGKCPRCNRELDEYPGPEDESIFICSYCDWRSDDPDVCPDDDCYGPEDL